MILNANIKFQNLSILSFNKDYQIILNYSFEETPKSKEHFEKKS